MARWISAAAIAAAVLLPAMLLLPVVAQHPPVPERCNMTGRGGAARCQCPGMVAEVRKAESARCWDSAGQKPPGDDRSELELRMLELFAPEKARELVACLGRVPDHCQVVERPAGAWGYKGKKTCQTSCKPDRCGCADSACKPHGEN
jgi:hypothetical protein